MSAVLIVLGVMLVSAPLVFGVAFFARELGWGEVLLCVAQTLAIVCVISVGVGLVVLGAS